MSAHRVLEQARAAGITMVADNGTLRLRGDKAVIAAITPDIRAHKVELLALVGKRQPTQSEAQELADLIAAVFNDWDPRERQEALRLALGDVEDALTCYRDLIARMHS